MDRDRDEPPAPAPDRRHQGTLATDRTKSTPGAGAGFAYVDAVLPGGDVPPLCRLPYAGCATPHKLKKAPASALRLKFAS